MIYALDTEFIEDGRTIDLLSIGIVAEDGRTLYKQNVTCDLSKANAWVKEHVLPQLVQCPRGTQNDHQVMLSFGDSCAYGDCPWLFRPGIRDAILKFIAYNTKPIFWGYYSAYDWVVLCQLFGAMMDLPHGWPMYCCDLRQHLDSVGSPISQPGDIPHNALSDALWIMQTLLTVRGIWTRKLFGGHPPL